MNHPNSTLEMKNETPEDRAKIEAKTTWGPALTKDLMVEFKRESTAWWMFEKYGVEVGVSYPVIGVAAEEFLILLPNGNVVNSYPRNVRVTSVRDLRVLVTLEE